MSRNINFQRTTDIVEIGGMDKDAEIKEIGDVS
jgi:hypothetical protein